jgi:ribose 5-phosphate isomerase B
MELIGIASDHGGFDLKANIISFLRELGYELSDMGPENSDSVDYPDYGIKIAQAITKNKVSRGIVICGTGIGMSIVVNRFSGIRGALCSDIFTAKLSREHNDSNILIMGGRVVDHNLAKEIVRVWLNTRFEGGRHLKRLDKISKLDKSINL